MNEETRKKSAGSSGGSSKSGASRSSGASGSSKSGASKSTGTGGSSKSSTSRSSGASGSSKSSTSRSSGAGGSSKSSTSKSSVTSGSSKSSTSRSSGTSGSSRSSTSRSSGRSRRAADEVPRNPARYTEDELELHNSPAARRLEEERRRKKYNKNKRLHNILFYGAISVAVISIVIILSVTVLFNITELTVERGRNIPYSDEEILAACGIEPGDNLFAVDIRQAALDVTTNLPYIEVCNITRRLPSTLELDVHSAVVLGSVTTQDGAYIVLSASGRALEYADMYDGQETLARINGMNMTFDGIGRAALMEEPDQLDVASELVVGFSLFGLDLDSVTFESSGTVSVGYDQRVTIRFGVPTNLSQKVQIAARMITDGKIAKNESGVLDLSIDERAVFTPDYLLGSE